jgi:hypothetical protein
MSAPPPLWLDYQRPPPGQQLPGLVLLAVSVLLAAWLGWAAHVTGDDLVSTSKQVAQLRQNVERQRVLAATANAGETKAVEAMRAVSASATRWEAFFTALEKAADDKVTLLALAPTASTILIDGEAQNLPAALDYAQRLQGGTTLANAHVARYEIARDQPGQPVRFTVEAGWREAR